ncbi:MAG TPA: hypothetical protein VFU47_08695 [Armatimonadota bacterium]|nr:hypothetical protein [Armatimonadota bacterium]
MDRELVDAGQVGVALAILSGLALLAALLLGAAFRTRKRAGLLRGALVAGALVLAGPLWQIYNGIEDRFGLDSVAALLINLALFVALGAAAGLLLRRLWPAQEDGIVSRKDAETAETT